MIASVLKQDPNTKRFKRTLITDFTIAIRSLATGMADGPPPVYKHLNYYNFINYWGQYMYILGTTADGKL